MASIQDKTGTEKAQGGVSTRTVRDEAITAQKIHADVKGGSHLFYDGKGQPLLFKADLSGVAVTTADTDEVALLPNGGHLFYNTVGDISTAPYGPKADDLGLNLAPDLTNNEAVSYIFGGALAAGVPFANPFGLTVAQAPADKKNMPHPVFMRMRFTIEDVSGSDDLEFGFRKAEDIATAPAGYADVAAFKIVSGDIKTVAIVGGGAPSLVDTTQNWADNEEHELMVVLFGNGIVKFFLDGKEPTVTQAYQFTDALVVVPFAYILQDAGLTNVYLSDSLELGKVRQIKNLKEE